MSTNRHGIYNTLILQLYNSEQFQLQAHSSWFQTFAVFWMLCAFFTPTCLWRWNRQCVPKRRYIKFRRWGITQKKAYDKSTVVCDTNTVCIQKFVPFLCDPKRSNQNNVHVDFVLILSISLCIGKHIIFVYYRKTQIH
jgi:hypothetical protein